MELVCFENTYVQAGADLQDNPDAFACITIDGFPADENAEGRVVCEVWLTNHKDVVVSWHDNGYRLHDEVLRLVEDAKAELDRMYDDAYA